MQSPFANTAAKLREMGLAVMPCGPGTKFPGAFTSANGWRTAFDWQKYCDRLPSNFEMDIWDRWPDAGICLALGRSSAPAGLQLIAVDIDTENAAEVAAIRACLPGSPVRKRGRKGETEFYLAAVTVPNRPFNDAGKRRMLDLLGHGRQTVLPPSMHPDCAHCGEKGTVTDHCSACGAVGAAYVWTTLDTLENFPVADLPRLPDDIADRLAAALAPFGHVEAPKLEAGEATISTHRSLNDAALANLAAWVPALNLYKCRQVGGKYKAVAAWRPSSGGRPTSSRATNLAIGPEGIKDCGENKGYTPIDLVMASCGADLDTAFRWLQERVAPAPIVVLTSRVVAEAAPARSGNLVALQLATFNGVAVQPVYEIAHIPAAYANAHKGTVIPAELCTPPGLIGDIVEWMNACSPVPSPQLNLSIALAFLGTIFGRHYQGPTEARTNLYCMGIAKSGFGKSYPIKCINAIEGAAGLANFFGPGGLKSDSALRLVLAEKNPVFVSVDEVGVLLSKILHRKASSHEAGLAELLLALFSAADDVYRGSDGAATRAVQIYNPHLCVSGMSTPSAFWGAFNTASSEHGLLPRLLIFDAGDVEPDEVTPTASRNDVPRSIVKAIHATLDARSKGNLAGVVGLVRPLTAPFSAGAAEIFEGIRQEAKARRRAVTGLEELAYTRFAEHVIKVALIFAIGCDPVAPVITPAALQWAKTIVEHTTRTLLDGTLDRVADNEYQADYKRILRIVKDAGAWGISTKVFYKLLSGSIEKRRLGDIIDQLKDAGDLEKIIGSGPKGGKPTDRLRVPSELQEAV